MRNLINKLGLFLMIISILFISFGCSPGQKPVEPNITEDIIDNENVEEKPKSTVIEPTNKVNTDGLSLLDSYEFDIDGNGNNEIISLYTTAEKDANGEIIWDDGQNWKLLVEGGDKDYILFDDYVQLGSIKFYAYTSHDSFYITTIQTGTANLKLTEYHFDKQDNNFVSNIKFEAINNVNMLYSSDNY
jgi:hypothetical protein